MNRIYELRKKLKMTQIQFAEFCDLSVISISRYEAGSKLSQRNAEKIANACHVSLDYLTDRENSPENPPVNLELSPEEQILIENFRRLSPAGKVKTRSYIKDMMIAHPKKD